MKVGEWVGVKVAEGVRVGVDEGVKVAVEGDSISVQHSLVVPLSSAGMFL